MYQRHVSFGEAVRAGFRHYFRFSGRAQRSEYWWFFLFVTLFCLGGEIVDFSILGSDYWDALWTPFSTLVFIITFIPSLSLGWRRMHDIGRSGWWNLLWIAPLVWSIVAAVTMFTSESELTAVGIGVIGLGVITTIIAIIYIIILLATDSVVGSNRYGPDVKYRSDYGSDGGEGSL